MSATAVPAAGFPSLYELDTSLEYFIWNLLTAPKTNMTMEHPHFQ